MAAFDPTGPSVAGLVSPNVSKIPTTANYLNFHDGSDGKNWAQQFLPELYEQEVERYGNRSVSSFLRMVGAEMPMASDQIIWSEQGRLHLAYKGTLTIATGVVNAIKDIDNVAGSSIAHACRVGQTIVFKTNGEFGTAKVSAVASDNLSLTLLPFGDDTFANLLTGESATEDIEFFVFGSQFTKGSGAMDGAVEPNFKSFTNSPIIIKDKFEVNGSDTAQIGWVEVSGEGGQSGYLWYMKAEGDTRVRFEDYLEMSLVEAELPASDSTVGVKGTEGLFAAIKSRGIQAANLFDTESASATELADFDALLAELDKQGSIEENMLFLDRSANLHIDDMLAGLNAHITGGLSFGVFENSEDMALNLGFTGFRRGSYDFYKTDWKYLNDKSTRGLIGGVKGVLVPAGTTSVYDQTLGKNIRRPFLHVRYRASETDDRRMKSWVTGSVGAQTTGDDKMEVHYLSERCLVVQAANNFVLFNS